MLSPHIITGVLLLWLQLQCVSSLSLHYDKGNHRYDELLISISPDVPGGNSLIVFSLNVYERFKYLRNPKWGDHWAHQAVGGGGQQVPAHCQRGLGAVPWCLHPGPRLLGWARQRGGGAWGPWGCPDQGGAHTLHLWRHSLHPADWRMWGGGGVHTGAKLRRFSPV